MFETMASFMLVEHANGAMFDPPLGPAVYPRAVAPNRRPYRTKDGYISALVYNDKQWSAFINAVRPAWDDEQLRHAGAARRQIDTVYALVARDHDRAHHAGMAGVVRRLEIPAAPLRTPEELFDNAT